MGPKFLQSTQYANFRVALFVTALLCILVAAFLSVYGKIGSLLLINGHHTPALDVLFRYGTYLGDGLIYLPLLAYCIFFNRSLIVPAVLSILIGLLLTHFLKRVVFPQELRPISLEAQSVLLHKITGLHMNRVNSFPSGHTATAFATALLLASVVKPRVWAIIIPFIPLFVGYSRVYLAQHFVTDVLGGMIVGIITAVLSLWLTVPLLRTLPQRVQARMQKPVVS